MSAVEIVRIVLVGVVDPPVPKRVPRRLPGVPIAYRLPPGNDVASQAIGPGMPIWLSGATAGRSIERGVLVGRGSLGY